MRLPQPSLVVHEKWAKLPFMSLSANAAVLVGAALWLFGCSTDNGGSSSAAGAGGEASSVGGGGTTSSGGGANAGSGGAMGGSAGQAGTSPPAAGGNPPSGGGAPTGEGGATGGMDNTGGTTVTDTASTDTETSTNTNTDSSTSPGGDSGTSTDTPGEAEWLPSWATSIQKTEPNNLPSMPFAGNTVRQFVWPTYSGSEIRLQLSNEKGSGPLEIAKVHIAKAGASSGQIDAGTDTAFTFEGNLGVTIAPGQTVWSDAVTFPLEKMQLTALTMQLGGSVPPEITGHPGARTYSYLTAGDAVAQADLSSGERIERWYFINAIEVMAPKDAYAVSILGDSITDGYGVMEEFKRWPDYLTVEIDNDPQLKDKVSVLNAGMGGNTLLYPNQDFMDSGVDRVARDILTRPKVKWVVVLMGVNDIIYTDATADAIIAGYETVIEQCKNAGIRVYGATITPFVGDADDVARRETVNAWIKDSQQFDAVIDLAAAVADPGNPQQLLPAYDNDGLHPSTAGYEAMGKAVDLSLFQSSAD